MIDQNHIKIYPNPTSNYIIIEIDNKIDRNYTLQVLNISGQVVYAEEIKNNEMIKKNIDLSEYSKGVYFIRVISDSSSYQEKILLQ